MDTALLTLNAGSSSLKFSVYADGDEPEELACGQVENIGPTAMLKIRGSDAVEIGAADHAIALSAIIDNARAVIGDRRVRGVGHRIVTGGIDFVSPTRLTDDVIAKLRTLEPLAPLHQPHNLAAVEAARKAFPQAVQIGCFDTAFHRNHPWVNDTFALPRRFYEKGVRRYGFHGLSYQYVTGELARIAPEIARGDVVICHLGNGASMCAVEDGRSIASTMGFSALDGLPMGTRSGQVDPGVLLYLMDQEKMSAAEITNLLYRESGLLGLSGISSDMRVLEASDAPEAEQAIDYFIFRIRRELGAMVAVIDGLDAVVFCGGIGENSAMIRDRVCAGMDWIGIDLDAEANAANALDIGTGRTRVMVVPTDEERVIARAVTGFL